MHIKNIFIISFIFILSGCAVPGVLPTETNIAKSRMYEVPYDKVWSAIIAGIAESNLNITTLEKDSGIIVLSNVAYEPDWAHEGKRGSVLGIPNYIAHRSANFNILATRKGAGKTLVQVNSTFKMQIRSGNNSQALPYQYQWHKSYSNGRLEQTILDGIERRTTKYSK